MADVGMVERAIFYRGYLSSNFQYTPAKCGINIQLSRLANANLFYFYGRWIVTYNLRDAVTLLTTHKHRHISQAMRVKMSEGFPKS